MSQASALMTTYAQLPIAFAYGKGVWLYDEQGRRYLDALSGIAVNTLGHAHAGLVAALSDQINKMEMLSSLMVKKALQSQTEIISVIGET